MSDFLKELSSDPVIEQMIKNLSTPQQNWSNFISDIEEKYNTAHISNIRLAVLNSANHIFKSDTVAKSSSEMFDENEFKKILGLFPSISVDGQSLQSPTDFANSALFNYFLNMASLNGDNDLYSFLLEAPVFQTKLVLKQEKMGSPISHIGQAVDSKDFSLLQADLIAFIKFCVNENSIVWYLLLLKLLFAIETRKVRIQHSCNDEDSTLIQSLSKGEMIDESDMRQISRVAKSRDHLKSFQSFPRLLVLAGNASKCIRYDLQGKATAIFLGITIPRSLQFMYYEVILKEKDAKLKGLRVGWSLKTITLVDNFSLGDGEDSWVLDFETTRFLHSEYSKVKYQTKIEKDMAKQSFTEQLERSMSAKSFDLDQEESILGDLFFESKRNGNDKHAVIPEQAQSKVEGLASTDSFEESGRVILATAETINLGAKKEEDTKFLRDCSVEQSFWSSINTIGCALNCRDGMIHFYGDGNFIGTSPLGIDLTEKSVTDLTAAVSCGTNSKLELNVGTSPFKYAGLVFTDLKRRCSIPEDTGIPDFSESSTIQSTFTTTSLYFNENREDRDSGESSCILVQNVCGDSLKTFTFEVSVRLKEVGQREMILFCCSPVLSGVVLQGVELEEQAVKIGIDHEGLLFFDLFNCERVKGAIIGTDGWQHLALSYTFHRSSGKANVTFMIDGAVVLNQEISNGRSNKPGKVHPRQVCIGGCMQNSKFSFVGELCNVRLWSIAKSADRIMLTLGRNKVFGVETDLLIFLPLEEGCGNVVRDFNSTKPSSRKSEILTIRGDFSWNVSPHEIVNEEPIQNYLNNEKNISLDVRDLLKSLTEQGFVTNPFLPCLLHKFLLSTEKLLHLGQTERNFKFKCSIPPAKAVINRDPLVLTFAHSLLIDLIKYFESGLEIDERLSKALFFSTLSIIEVNIMHVAGELTLSQLFGNDLRSKILISLLYFVGLPNSLHNHFTAAIREKAVTIVMNQMDFFIPDKISSLRLLLILLELENKNQDKMSTSLRRAVSNSSSDKSVFYSHQNVDPLPALLYLDTAGRKSLLQPLCSRFANLNTLSDIVTMELRPFRFDPSKGMLMFKRNTIIENSKKRPYLGAIVKRGPDWRYGDEDGGEGSHGIVLQLPEATNNLNDLNEITVGWKNGFIECYRYDYSEASTNNKRIYDVEVVSAGDTDDEVVLNKFNVQEQSDDRRLLLYTPLDVFNVLICGHPHDTISKRSVLTYVKDIASSAWQEAKDLLKPLNALAAKLTPMEICNIYHEFYDSFAVRVEKQNPLHFLSGLPPAAVTGKVGLLKELVKHCFEYLSRQLSRVDEPVLSFLSSLQYSLFVGFDHDVSAENRVLSSEHDCCEEFARELENAGFRWNWKDSSVSQIVPNLHSNESRSKLKSAKLENSIVLRSFSFERQGVNENIQIRHRSRCIDISIIGDREWNTIASDQVMDSANGVFRWYVKVKFSERRSHFMLGLCTSEFNPDEFLGQDKNSWGFSQSLDYFHNGKKRKVSIEGAKITPGSILEMTYNSYLGTFGLIEVQPDAVTVLVESEQFELEGVDKRTLFPAISMFTPGDIVSLITDSSEISAIRMKLMTLQSAAGTCSNAKVNYVVNLGAPNRLVISYTQYSLTTLRDILSQQEFFKGCSSYKKLLWLILHNLTHINRWTCPCVDKDGEILELCYRSLGLIGSVFLVNSDVSNYSYEQDSVSKILQLIASSISIFSSRLIEGLIQNQKFVSLHRIDRLYRRDELPKFAKESKLSVAITESFIPLQEWIHNPIFSSGLKNDLSFTEPLIRSIRSKEPQMDMFLRWISCFDRTHINFRKIGGDQLDACVKTLFLSILNHCGLLNIVETLKSMVYETVEKLGKLESTLEEYFIKHLKPPVVLIRAWESAMKLKVWSKDVNANNQRPYEQISSKLYDRILFTFKLHPCYSEISLNFSANEITSWISQCNSFLKSTFDAESLAMESFNLLQKFIIDDVSTESLEALCKAIDEASTKRAEGFKHLKKMLNVLSFNSGTALKSIFVDSVASLLKGTSASWSFGNSPSQKSKNQGWHYLDGLYGLSSATRSDLKSAFNLVFSALISELADASNSFHLFKLAILNSLAMRVIDQDHEVLVRVNFFPVLKELLDENLAEESSLDSPLESANAERVVAVGMKLFIWMALQVASSNTEFDPRGKMKSLAQNIKLQKVQSGPATLSDAVFDTLYRLLNDWSLHENVTALASTAISSKTQAISLESATLLHCVSRNERCLKVLCRTEWIELLVKLVCFADVECKLKCLLILSETVTRINPRDFTINLTTCFEKLGFEDASLFYIGNSAKSLIQFMFYLTGLSSLKVKFANTRSRLAVFGVTSEAVTLLRKLYSSKSWAAVVEETVYENLEAYEVVGNNVGGKVDDIRNAVLLGVLFTLGGHSNVPYLSCPVVFKVQHGLTVGVIKGLNETNDQVEVIAMKLKSLTPSETLKVHYSTVEDSEIVTTSYDNLILLQRCNVQASFISSRILSKSIVIANGLVAQVNDYSSLFVSNNPPESKSEDAAIEEKNDKQKYGFENPLVFKSFLFTVLLKVLDEFSRNPYVPSIQLKQLLQVLDWRNFFSMAQADTATIGLQDISFYDEHLASCISYLTFLKSQPPKSADQSPALVSSTMELKEDIAPQSGRVASTRGFSSKGEMLAASPEEELDPRLVDSLEGMGFPRKLCVVALHMRGWDPSEALNYLLSNGGMLMDTLNSENENHDGDRTIIESEWEMTREEKPEAVLEKFDTGIPTVYHCVGNSKKFLPFYAEPSFDSERLGCVFPGDDMGVVEEKEIDDNTWYRLSFSDFDGNNYHSTYGDEIYEIFVWVPKIVNGQVMVEPGSYEGDNEGDFNDPVGDSLSIDRYYKIIGSNGALVRDGIEIGSNEIASLNIGDVVHACEEGFNSEGTIRLRLDSPMHGWISKIFGLVERISSDSITSVQKELDEEITFKNIPEPTETEQLEGIEDSMEVLTGTDVYSRDDRFFGHRQGLDYRFFSRDSKVDSQVAQSRRTRLSGMKSILSYFTNSFSCNWLEVERTVQVLLNLRCRKIVLTFMLRASSNLEDLHFFVHKCNELHENEGEIFIRKFYRALRLTIFRGDMISKLGTEIVTANKLLQHARISEGKSIEDSLSAFLTNLITYHSGKFADELVQIIFKAIVESLVHACDLKYADHCWTDCTFDDDTDSDVFRQPNVQYAAWATEVLMKVKNVDSLKRLLHIWIRCVRGSSMSLKTIAFSVLALILTQLRNSPLSNMEEMSSFVFGIIPVRRLSRFASKRLWQELEDSPAFSRFIQSFVHFMCQIEISLNAWKVESALTVTRETEENKGLLRALRFDKSDSYVQLFPPKDLTGSWTLDVKLRRQKHIVSHYSPGAYAIEKEPVLNKSGFLRNSGEKLGISKLLKLLLGTSSSKHLEVAEKSEVLKDDDSPASRGTISYNPSYLVSSSKYHIKIQRGGRIFTEDNFNDPLQATEFVECESLCLSYGQVGNEDKSFDFIVPYDEWVKLTLVADTSTGLMSLYVNGSFLDSQSGIIPLPIATIGSTKLNQSFAGEFAQFMVWSFAKTAKEIQQCNKDNSLINLRFDAGLNFGIYDSRGYLMACRPHSCGTAEIENLPFPDSTFSSSTFRSLENIDHELTGTVNFKPVGAGSSLVAKGMNEIITICYKKVEQGEEMKGSAEEIFGLLTWVERNVQCYFIGEIFDQTKILLRTNSEHLYSGAPERLSWLKDFILEGTITAGKIEATCELIVRSETNSREEMGLIKLDRSHLPDEISVTENAVRGQQLQTTIEVKKDKDDGQYVAIFEVSPYPMVENNLEIVDLTLYGLVMGQGCYWIDFTIKSNAGNIAFGFCTENALVHPDASVDANDGTWTYSTSGSASNGANLFICETAEDGDVISLQLNTVHGFIRFLKNRQVLVSFELVSEHPALKRLNHDPTLGIRPFISLASAEDCVQYAGVTKDGVVVLSFADSDPLQRCKLFASFFKGSLHGYGLMSLKNASEWWFGSWHWDLPIGVHVRFEDIKSVDLRVCETRDFNTHSSLNAEGVKCTAAEAVIDQLKGAFLQFKCKFPELFPPNLADHFENSSMVTSLESKGVMTQENIISISFLDSLNEPTPIQIGIDQSFADVFSTYSQKRGFYRTSFLFQYNGNTISDFMTPVSLGMQNNALINVNVKSQICSMDKFGDPVSDYFGESEAPFIIQIVYEAGATVRNGIEIEESLSIRTLKPGEVIEATRKEFTNEGIGRYRIADGWISEKLRGGTESPVSLVLREKFEVPKKYRVIREDGAKVRASASLESEEKGICPQDIVLTVSEKRLVHFADMAPTARLKIIEPIEWTGWISDKPHLLEEIKDNEDPELDAELKRRNQVRANRKLKTLVNKPDSSSSTPYYLRVKGKSVLSMQTFFLLRRNKYTEVIHFSEDLMTITCPDSSGGRSLVLGSKGFSHGVHYWEVQVNNASWGSVFIGVAPEDAMGWNGFGFINYRAVQSFGSETLYGSYFGVGDKIGVLLDMDRGTLSFFKDGEDFNVGKVVVINMGIAYHNVRKTIGRYSSSSTLYPCFGMKSSSDQLSIANSHWISEEGVNATKYMQNILSFSHVLRNWWLSYGSEQNAGTSSIFSEKIIAELYEQYLEKSADNEFYVESRPGIMVKVKCNIEEFYKLLGESFVKEYSIFSGAVVNTVYGKGTLLGISDQRLWYSCERNFKKAWYWLGSEFKEIMSSGRMTVSYINDVVETNLLPLQANTQSSADQKTITKLNKHEFSEVLLRCSWTLQQDAILTKCINQLAYQLDQSPLYVAIQNVTDYFTRNKIQQISNKPIEEIIVRFLSLCYFNRGIMIMLPLVDLSTAETSNTLVGTNISSFDESKRQFSILSSMKDLIVNLKSCIFTTIKTEFWGTVVTETTAPTNPPPDEYERPDEIREISVNRIQARNALRRRDQLSFTERYKLSVFGQLMEGIQHWDSRSYRRSYIHMQDAGQPRAFFVRFVGEGVDDQGGPYRAVFQTAIGEEIIQLLSLFNPCSNARDEMGDHRDRYVLNSASNEFQENVAKIFIHLGKLIGIACRHKILLPLPLVPLIWKSLGQGTLDITDLQSIEISLMNSLQQIPSYIHEMNSEQIQDLLVQALVDCNTPQEIRILPVKAKLIVRNAMKKEGLTLSASFDECDEYEVEDAVDHIQAKELHSSRLPTEEITYSIVDIIQLIQYLRLTAQNRLLQYLFEGLSFVLPVEIMSIFTADELEVLFSGENTVDLEVLKKATEYESVTMNDSHIQYFWQALEQMNSEERSQFINFCSGRSRLPTAASEFPMPFKLTGPPANASKNPDNYLPIARTCFFSLSLPQYSSFEVCLSKLKYAINNTELMDADFIDRRGTSGWENIR